MPSFELISHASETWGTFSTPQVAADLLELDRHLGAVPKDGLIIDLGSGAGFSLEAMIYVMRPDIHTIGIDPGYFIDSFTRSEREDIGQIGSFFEPDERQKLASDEAWCHRFVAGTAEELPFRGESADMVVSFAALPQYARNYEQVFGELVRVLKPGSFAILGPMRDWVFSEWEKTVSHGEALGQITSYQHATKLTEVNQDQFVDAHFTELKK